jgi:dTDP-4-amino-4,6-dideoxygalactose transaminase
MDEGEDEIMKVPFWNLSRQYDLLREEILEKVDEVLKTGEYVLGKYVGQFEQEFASYCGAKFAIGVNSGTDAMVLALKAIDLQKGDEVIVPALTFISTANVVVYCGGIPVFVDVEPDTLNMDPSKIERVITGKTKAIIPVHFHGQPADIDPITEIAQQHGLSIIDDCAQAMGAEYKGTRIGILGDISCFSFYPTKNLGAFGDGGMVVTGDEKLAAKVRSLRDYGRRDKYVFDSIGFNSRLDEIQAALLRVKLKHVDGWNEKRRSIAKRYNELLSLVVNITKPVEKEYAKHVYWVYTVRTKHRGKLQQGLTKMGVGTHIIYAIPIPFQKAFEYLSYKQGDFPVAEKCAEDMISIPMFPELTEEEQHYVVKAIRDCMVA